jgi:hypothetical protein
MSPTKHTALTVVLMSVGVLVVFSLMLNATVPAGWRIAGSKPAEYEAGVDASAVYNHHSSAYLRCKNATVDGFGTLMQEVSSEKYAGKRIRLSAKVKAEEWSLGRASSPSHPSADASSSEDSGTFRTR